LLFLAGACVLPVHARNPGTEAAPFLTIGFGSRAQALGNSFVGLADDASSAYFNPAGLAAGALRYAGPSRELQAGRSDWFQDISIHQMALAQFRPGTASWAVSLTQLGVGGLEHRVEESDEPLGTFSAEDMAFGVSFARSFGFSSPLSAGVTAKVVEQRIAHWKGRAMAIDAGLLANFRVGSQRFSAGFASRNLGTRLRVGSEAFPSPLYVPRGLAWRGLVNQSAEVIFKPGSKPAFAFGTEYVFLGVFSLRGGYLLSQKAQAPGANTVAGLPLKPGFTGGFGMRVMNLLGVDYAVAPFGDLGFAQRITLSCRF